MHPDLALAPATAATAATEFAELLHRHRRIVFKVASSYAWLAEDRADLAQEISAQLWSAFPGYDRSRPFSTWMYRVALNTAMVHARAQALRGRHHGPADEQAVAAFADPVDGTAEAEANLLLRQAMACLDPASRALLLLHLEARDAQEIGDILGLSPSNVGTRLHRIRQQLRERLSTDDGSTKA